ncbi:hypothetical protein E2C01_033840 [Portunus trituberculatus]|uniref:Uncharacterized protein n=1 Tax=Portunus trituberculatus TaxID=210409 RepID=A0A5B7F6R5_PORTR|nr:hypothetical protein [Portunus trituberculatus]
MVVCGMRYHLLRALVVNHFLLPEPKPRQKRRAWENPDLYKNYTRIDRELLDSIVEAVTQGERADWHDRVAAAWQSGQRVACDSWWERRCCPLHTSSQFPLPLMPFAARKGAMVQ